MTTRTTGPACVCALMIALTGCGPRAIGPAAQRAEQPHTVTTPRPTVAAVGEGLTSAGRAALRFSLAARSWTPATYEAQYRRQLSLSTGALRRALKQAPPTRAQLAGYRDDRAAVDAHVIAVTSLSQTATQARVRVLLDERSTAAGQTVKQRASYLVELQHRSGRWRTVAFAVHP